MKGICVLTDPGNEVAAELALQARKDQEVLMALNPTYRPSEAEPRLLADWQARGIYQFDPQAGKPVYSIDTPPPTVSGLLHLGHVYSYSQTDFIARFWRMNGCNVFYPMGFDDNGLPTERLVERWKGINPTQVGREAFIQQCLEVSKEAEKGYEGLWQRLGLSIDWRYTYRTIDDQARRISQQSFIDLYHKGLVYRNEAPAIWCPECRTAIAQADLDDLERTSEFITLAFKRQDGERLAGGHHPPGAASCLCGSLRPPKGCALCGPDRPAGPGAVL